MLAKDPASATLQRLKELRIARHSLRKTAATLQEEGLAPPPGWKKWHHSTMRTVQVHGPYTPTGRLLWDFLPHTVWAALDQEADHALPLERGLDALRAMKGCPERERLWEAPARLAASRVTLEGTLDRHRLIIPTPLLAAVLTENTVSFHFPPPLVKLLKNPRQYTRLQAIPGGNR